MSEPERSVPAPFGQYLAPAPHARTHPLGRVGLAVAAGTGAGIALLGLPVGLLWAVISPRVALIRTAAGTSLVLPETKAFIAADGIFLLLGAGIGVLCGLVVWALARRHGEAAVAGLAVGGLLAAVVGWKVGHQLFLGDYRQAMRTAAAGAHFSAAVNLRAKGALVGWPVAALLTYLALMVFVERPARLAHPVLPPIPDQPLATDYQPPAAEDGPPPAEHRPPPVEHRPPPVEHRPPPVEHRPPPAGRRPPTPPIPDEKPRR